MTKNDGPHWFVAYVRSCQERKVAESLSSMGYEYYLPVQREVHQWSDRKKIVQRLVIPRMIFIRCMESERLSPVKLIPALLGYMANGPYRPVIVRDGEMSVFMEMVEHGGRKVSVSSEPLHVGDHVRVVSGPLEGIECELVEVSGKRCLGVKIGILGTAYVDMANDSVKKIPRE